MNTHQNTPARGEIRSSETTGAAAAPFLSSAPNPLNQLSKVQISCPPLDPSLLHFADGITVIDRANYFVIRVPALPNGGEPLVYPEGTENAGKPMMLRADGTPERGIILFNEKTSTWQPVRGNGREVILAIDVKHADAAYLAEKIAEEGGKNITAEGLHRIVTIARDQLGISDFHRMEASALPALMAPIDAKSPLHMVSTQQRIFSAIHVQESFSFNDFGVEKAFPNGGIVLLRGDDIWPMEVDFLRRNFKVTENGIERPLGELYAEFPKAIEQREVRRILGVLEERLKTGKLGSPNLETYRNDEIYNAALKKAGELFETRHPEYYAEVRPLFEGKNCLVVGLRRPIMHRVSSSIDYLARLIGTK